MRRDGDGADLSARPRAPAGNFRHPPARNVRKAREYPRRIQPAGGGSDSQGILRRSAIGRPGWGIMIIAQISDTHIALDTPDADQRIRDFELTVADIIKLDPAPDVIVHTGDIVHNGRQDEYAQAVATLANGSAAVYVLGGIRDNRANLHRACSTREYLAPDSNFIDYAIDDYPVRLI